MDTLELVRHQIQLSKGGAATPCTIARCKLSLNSLSRCADDCNLYHINYASWAVRTILAHVPNVHGEASSAETAYLRISAAGWQNYRLCQIDRTRLVVSNLLSSLLFNISNLCSWSLDNAAAH